MTITSALLLSSTGTPIYNRHASCAYHRYDSSHDELAALYHASGYSEFDHPSNNAVRAESSHSHAHYREESPPGPPGDSEPYTMEQFIHYPESLFNSPFSLPSGSPGVLDPTLSDPSASNLCLEGAFAVPYKFLDLLF
jgi:hypothetical protein